MITDPFPATSPAPTPTTPAQRLGGILFSLIFFLAGGAFFYGMAVQPYLQSVAARTWVETPCRVVSSEVKSNHDGDGTTYRPEIHYVYRVQGREYHADRYQFLRFSSSGRADKAAVVARFPRGKHTVCYVNPKAPAEAVLDRNFASAGFFTLIPLAFMAVGGTLFFQMLRAGRSPAALPERELSPEGAAGVAAYVQPATSRIRITTPLRGGTEFYFPPGRSLVGTLILGAVLAGLSGGISHAAEQQKQALAIGLGVAVFIVAFILSYIWTAWARVTIDGGMVTVTHCLLGIARNRMVAATDIAKIKPWITGSSSGPKGTTVYYGLEIHCQDDTDMCVGRRIPNQREAEWLAARMTEAVRKP